jgi:hypothetical protein
VGLHVGVAVLVGNESDKCLLAWRIRKAGMSRGRIGEEAFRVGRVFGLKFVGGEMRL